VRLRVGGFNLRNIGKCFVFSVASCRFSSSAVAAMIRSAVAMAGWLRLQVRPISPARLVIGSSTVAQWNESKSRSAEQPKNDCSPPLPSLNRDEPVDEGQQPVVWNPRSRFPRLLNCVAVGRGQFLPRLAPPRVPALKDLSGNRIHSLRASHERGLGGPQSVPARWWSFDQRRGRG
jgi:hypothetical protein